MGTPTAGGTYPAMVRKVRLRDPDPFANEFAASRRAVYDLSISESSAATIIFSIGQSGNPFSAHYRDLAQRWGSSGPGPTLIWPRLRWSVRRCAARLDK